MLVAGGEAWTTESAPAASVGHAAARVSHRVAAAEVERRVASKRRSRPQHDPSSICFRQAPARTRHELDRPSRSGPFRIALGFGVTRLMSRSFVAAWREAGAASVSLAYSEMLLPACYPFKRAFSV